MANSFKERLANDLEKAKQEGGLRVDRIREIVKTAVIEAIAEFKAGSGEIRDIAKDAVTGVTEVVKEKGSETKDEIMASIEGVIEGVTGLSREQLAQKQAQVETLQAEIEMQEQALDAEVNSALVAIAEVEKTTPVTLKSLIQAAIATLRDRQFSHLQAQYLRLKQQLAQVDTKLAERYGDRYEEVKRQLDTAKAWYQETKAKVEAGEPNPIDQKQAEWAEKAAEVGSSAAQFEQTVKQKVKTWLHQTADKL
jgi:hypothetical protein